MATEKRRRRWPLTVACCALSVFVVVVVAENVSCARDSRTDSLWLVTARPHRRFENPTRTENEIGKNQSCLKRYGNWNTNSATERDVTLSVLCAFQSSWQRDRRSPHAMCGRTSERESESDREYSIAFQFHCSARLESLAATANYGSVRYVSL